jgi:transposase
MVENREILYVDEAALYLLPGMGRTWAKRGQTPTLLQGCRYQHISIISAISAKGDLHYQLQESNFIGETVVQFLKSLMQQFENKLLIIWDGAKIHHDNNVKAFLENENNDHIYLHRIPPYSPELNADEQVWKAIKKDSLKNVVCKTITELKEKANIALQQLKTEKNKIANFFKHPKVAFYTT